MAILIKQTCRVCGGPVVNSDKKKAYVHVAEVRGIKVDHAAQVVATVMGRI